MLWFQLWPQNGLEMLSWTLPEPMDATRNDLQSAVRPQNDLLGPVMPLVFGGYEIQPQCRGSEYEKLSRNDLVTLGKDISLDSAVPPIESPALGDFEVWPRNAFDTQSQCCRDFEISRKWPTWGKMFP